MEFDLNALTELGVDTKTGMEYTGGKEKYLSALQRFYKTSENNRRKVWEFLTAGDMENLSIAVHALKSNAKMLGAADLAEGFEKLELASRENDRELVSASIDGTMAGYEKLLEVIKPLGEMETFKAPGEISAEEAKKTADALLDALDEFDDELAKALVRKLSGYPFRITQKGKLREAEDQINDFMYEEAADLIREILPAIE